jgi:hypothetical protein
MVSADPTRKANFDPVTTFVFEMPRKMSRRADAK